MKGGPGSLVQLILNVYSLDRLNLRVLSCQRVVVAVLFTHKPFLLRNFSSNTVKIIDPKHI
jgi:hypothetical protein